MTNREKILYLKRYVWLDRRINTRINEIEKWRSRIGKITATLSDMPGGGGSIYKNGDIAIIDKIVDISRQIDQDIDELIIIKEEIESFIGALNNETLKTLMEYRYIDGQSFEWIAAEMYYSWRWIHKLHKRALEEIQIGQ